MDKCIAEKIDVARIIIERVGTFTAKAAVTSMAAANHVLRKWSHTVLNEGHDTCDFLIVFEDGKTFNGQYDLLPYNENFRNLSQHIRTSLQYVIGNRKPKGLPKFRYQELVCSFDNAEVEQAKDVLKHYEI
ncbi:MAG: hypothetical protein Q8Q81_08430 [Oxalobacteraceae bacterium]|nr:hypothetical protein [Oxalobacteraceae bacterium]